MTSTTAPGTTNRPIRFDQNGDLVEAPVTIFRVVGKRRRNSSSLPEFRGAVVDRVITARAALLR